MSSPRNNIFLGLIISFVPFLVIRNSSRFSKYTNKKRPIYKLSVPSGALLSAIQAQYGAFSSFKELFTEAALSVFDSGYAWLVCNALGDLQILTLPNQDCPLSMLLYPILNLDVWEHAYYLKHYNDRN